MSQTTLYTSSYLQHCKLTSAARYDGWSFCTHLRLSETSECVSFESNGNFLIIYWVAKEDPAYTYAKMRWLFI